MTEKPQHSPLHTLLLIQPPSSDVEALISHNPPALLHELYPLSVGRGIVHFTLLLCIEIFFVLLFPSHSIYQSSNYSFFPSAANFVQVRNSRELPRGAQRRRGRGECVCVWGKGHYEDHNCSLLH